MLTNKTILVVDDDIDILEAVTMLLKAEGFNVKTATKGEDVESIHKNLPDLILLDILLSGKDGREIAKKLKTQDHTKHIPIIMMSAHPTAHRSIKEYLADDFISKPFDIDHLVIKIKEHIGN